MTPDPRPVLYDLFSCAGGVLSVTIVPGSA
jgi:hypothetical protein